MSFAIFTDWSEELGENYDNWENVGRRVLIENCKHKSKESGDNNLIEYQDYCEKCEVAEDTANPMMNYRYHLEIEPDNKAVLKVVKNTNCSVMYSNSENKYYIVLCGGGMDLSQNIALSYIWLQKWIPEDLLFEVAKQPCLSLGSKNYKNLAREVIKQSRMNARNFKENAKRWRETLKNFTEKEKGENDKNGK